MLCDGASVGAIVTGEMARDGGDELRRSAGVITGKP